MKFCIASVSVLLVLCNLTAAFQRPIIDDRMDKIVEKFANFKDIVNLNRFLYELLNMVADVTPSYGTVQYFHNQHPQIIFPAVVENPDQPEEESAEPQEMLHSGPYKPLFHAVSSHSAPISSLDRVPSKRVPFNMSPRRLCIVLFVSVAIVTVKGLPGIADGLWSKVSSSFVQASPAHALFANQPFARAFSSEEPVPVQKPKEPEPNKVQSVVPPKLKAAVPVLPEELTEKLLAVEPEKPQVVVKTADSSAPEIPIFAKLILGDPSKPKLATVESLRNINWRSVETSLELPNKHTMPMVDELLQKTEELLRLFQELKLESTGFVSDVETHNENALKEYIGYYN
uniref:Uncharacterized protein n=1 Tax=Anopheles arabiensis TaxID=7173 RepID=A0A182IGY1_ANOAR